MSLKTLWIYSHFFFAWLQVAVPQYSTQGVTIRLAHFSFEWWKTSYLKSFYGIGGPIIHFIVPEECQRSTLSYSKVKNANDDKFFHKWLDAATILKCGIIWLSREKIDYKFRIFLKACQEIFQKILYNFVIILLYPQ